MFKLLTWNFFAISCCTHVFNLCTGFVPGAVFSYGVPELCTWAVLNGGELGLIVELCQLRGWSILLHTWFDVLRKLHIGALCQ